jgi:hypothetical protein
MVRSFGRIFQEGSEAHLRSALRFGDRTYVRSPALQRRFERLIQLKPPPPAVGYLP